ncbi:MAG: hypothetical protein ACLQGV_10875 [Bryobacteraceae bacterium]
MERDDEFIGEIAPDVLRVLARKQFSEALDDQMCPTDPARQRVSWAGTYATSTAILTECGFDEEAIAEITQVLASRGGFCDCEIPIKLAEVSLLKPEYWKARAQGSTPPDSRFSHLGA